MPCSSFSLSKEGHRIHSEPERPSQVPLDQPLWTGGSQAACVSGICKQKRPLTALGSHAGSRGLVAPFLCFLVILFCLLLPK